MDISENNGQNHMNLTFIFVALAGSSMRKIAARAAVNLVVYHIWRERNARIFRDEVKDLQRLKIEALQEMNMILGKITRMKLTQRNVAWAKKMGICPNFVSPRQNSQILLQAGGI
uniref:Uncharacterized protein n=1 Tax=Kalanchoe fedtschenkoi TaxID=63787 RepID=A0A7N0ZW78_KALFE